MLGGPLNTLLYHPPDNPVEESPFDRAILELAIGQDVKIVSPYISLSYLERIIGVSQSWRLISDVLEWLSATPVRERNAVYEFLKCHEGLVHHYPAIHAKTVISQAAAYTGSANLTDAGVLRRTEFGIVLREKAQIDEIHQWFAALWAQTSPPLLTGVRELITWLNQLSVPAEDTLSAKRAYLESNARKVRARLVKVLGEHPIPMATRLAERQRAQIPSATATKSEMTTKALQIRTPAKESEPFNLEAAVSSFIEKHAALGFSLAELHSSLMGLSSSVRVRETYFAVLNYCASRPQSIFFEDAVNRLVYRQGRFVQSSKTHLDEVLAPLDVLLEWLFKYLSFSEQRPLPATAPTALAPRPPHAAYRVLVSELATGGFIHLEQGARLNDRALWSPRLRLLTRAHQAWESSLAKHQLQKAAALSVQEVPLPLSIENSVGAMERLERSDLPSPAASQGDGDASFVEQENARTRMLERLDVLFEQLAQLYIREGDVLETSLPALVERLSKASALKDGEVEQALNGSSPYIQSPFMALPTTSLRKRVRLFPLLEGNADLSRLQRTMKVVETSAKLLELSRPRTAQAIPPSTKKSALQFHFPLERTESISDETADRCYRTITERIYKTPVKRLKFQSLKALMRFLSGGYAKDELIGRLIYGKIPEHLQMYRLEYSMKLAELSVSYKNIDRFPATKEYLERVVWAPGSSHRWLPPRGQMTLTGANNNSVPKRKDEVRPGSVSHSLKEDYYYRIVKWIHTTVPSQKLFREVYQIYEAISEDLEIPGELVSSLVTTSRENSPLLRPAYARGNFRLELVPTELRRYRKAAAYLEGFVWSTAKGHRWLLKQAEGPSSNSAAKQLPKPGRAEVLGAQVDSKMSKPDALPSMGTVMKNALSAAQRNQCDALFAQLLQLAITHGNPLPPNRVTGELSDVQQQAETVFRKVSELCRQYPDTVRPAIALERPTDRPAYINVVIRTEHQEDVNFLPMTARLLVSPGLTIKRA